jgi:hypothetical protein
MAMPADADLQMQRYNNQSTTGAVAATKAASGDRSGNEAATEAAGDNREAAGGDRGQRKRRIQAAAATKRSGVVAEGAKLSGEVVTG